jgi:hypothetical protein
MKRIMPQTLDYSNRDFIGLKARLQDTIRSVFPVWTDFSIANFGNMLVESMCFVGDVLNFYQDRRALEAFITTMKERASAQRHGALVGFDMVGATAATVDLTLTLHNPSGSQVLTIPYGAPFRSVSATSPQDFMCCALNAADRTFAIGQASLIVALRQAQMKSQSFMSSEKPNQEFVLTYYPFLDGSLSGDSGLPVYPSDQPTVMVRGIKADNGDYQPATNNSFYGYGPTDCVFVVWVDDFDCAHVLFPNGINGAIPRGTIYFASEVGGGEAGNVDADTIRLIERQLTFPDGTPAQLTCTNVYKASGGAPRMTVDEAREQIPAQIRIQERTVSKEDFEDVSISTRGVARTLEVTSNEYAGVYENHGILYVVAKGEKLSSGRTAPGVPSSTLLASVVASIAAKPPTTTFTYEALAAPFLDVLVSTKVFFDRGVSKAVTAAAIRANLADFFAALLADGTPNPAIDFGANLKSYDGTVNGEITWSDVFNAINDTIGVRKIDEGNEGLLLNSLRQSVTLTAIQFPRLSSVTIYDGDAGAYL